MSDKTPSVRILTQLGASMEEPNNMYILKRGGGEFFLWSVGRAGIISALSVATLWKAFFYSTTINFDFSYFKATTFSNPVYESVYRSETSLGSEIFRDKDPSKVEFRRSKADFSNPVYEALLAHNGSRRSGTVFWGSTEDMNGQASNKQETNC